MSATIHRDAVAIGESIDARGIGTPWA